jgi:hypothetical protein
MPLIQKATGDQVGVFGVTPEGQAIAAVVASDGGGTKATQSHMELMDPGADHGLVLPDKTGSTPRGAEGGATANAHTVVWTEGSSTDITNDNWVIEAYNRDTQQTHVIATAAEGANTPTAPNQTIPYIAHDRVYWIAATTTGNKERPVHANLYSRDLAAATPVRQEVADVENLSANGDDLFYTKSHFVDPAIPQGVQFIHHINLSTGADTVAQQVQVPANGVVNFSSSGGDVAWSVTQRDANGTATGAVMTIRKASGATTTITGTGVAYFNPVLTPDLLLWTGNDYGQIWLYDRHTNTVVDLGNAPGYTDVQAGGPLIFWRDAQGHRLTATLATGASSATTPTSTPSPPAP